MICTGCKEDKDESCFCIDSTHNNGRSSRCKTCKNIYNRGWKLRNPEKLKTHRQMSKTWRLDNLEHDKARNRAYIVFYRKRFTFGRKHKQVECEITPEQYCFMWLIQNGCCAICKCSFSDLKRRACIDHSHKGDKQVRGLLCNNCNTAIGLLKEDFDTMLSAIDYLMDREPEF